MIKNLRAHVVLNCEATSLLPFHEYLEKYNWTLCFNDATDLRCLARLGVGGSVRQIGGPNEKNQDDVWNGPKRRVSFAIFLRLSGVRLFPVELMRHQKEVISLVKNLKIMKTCAVLE